ncbi:MAG: amino acid adenylation domain-containing protein [Peptococcaceae bacterium]|nr:amino acid adenylation domain-containing protein [Peptococcaceae bacterium]
MAFETYPLTGSQQSILIIEQFYPGTSYVNLAATLRFQGSLDYERLNESINSLIKNNIALRTRMLNKDNHIVQYYAGYRKQEIELFDFSHPNGREDYSRWTQEKTLSPFSFYEEDLYYFAIIQFSLDEFGIFLKCHHVIADFWSVILLVNQLVENYQRLMEGSTLKESTCGSYIDHIQSEQKYLASSRYYRDMEYWDNKIKKILQTTLFNKRKNNSIAARGKSYYLTPDISSKIKEICADWKITPFILFSAAASLYYWKKLGRDIIAIGTTVINRSSIQDKKTFGAFFSNLPFIIEVNSSLSFKDYLKYLNAEWLELLRHSSVPYVNVLKNYRDFHKVKNELFDFSLAYLNASLEQDRISVTIEHHFIQQEVNTLRLNIDDMHNEGAFHFDYFYGDEVLLEDDIQAMHEGMLNLIARAISNVNINISELSLLSEEEERLILNEFSSPNFDDNPGKNIIDLFLEQVKRSPAAIALVFEDQKLTYQEVDDKSNQFARFLLKRGTKKEEIIGFCVERSLDLVIGILGILKAGAAYLPIDPGYPEERIAYMLKDSHCRFCVTNSNLSFKKTKDGEGVEIINMKEPTIWAEETKSLVCYSNPSDLAVVIYTSGSTGLPKGAMIEHRALSSYVQAITCKLNLQNKTILSLTTLSFDIFFTENILPVLAGMKVIIANNMEQANPEMQTKLLAQHKIDVLGTTPSRIIALLNNSTSYLDQLSILIIGGEVFPVSLLTKLKKYTTARIYNAYGPTEATIISSMKLLEYPEEITIGRPLSNTRLYILDESKKPVPIGAVGEIFIGGNGLARGYVNKPELTAERFVPNPFIPGTRMYKTGDLGKWQKNGEVIYIGRNDHQVKLRGYRIELGEIENVLLRNNHIEQAVVTSNSNTAGRVFLCAYLIGDQQMSVTELRHYLAQYLPDYMIPHKFIWLSVLPLTYNGKIDRNSLPDPNIYEECDENEYVAPRDEIEQSLAEIWSKVLEIPKVGIEDNFFTLGGDSLAILEILSSTLSKEWNLSAQEFYEYPCIRELASLIKDKTLKEKEKVDVTNPYSALDWEISERYYLPGTLRNGNVLLTGATGFLGMHILAELLENSFGNVYCLVRGQDYEKRFWDLVQFYFPNLPLNVIQKKVVLIPGDISEKRFGLSEQEYDQLAENIEAVIHSASLVKHFGFYSDFDRINVQGTREVINFCLNDGKHLSYISTLSVSGNYMRFEGHTFAFTEKNLYSGQNYRSNVYVRSKIEAESLMIKAAENGLKATIFRVGNLTGRFSDGQFQLNIEENAFYRRLRSIFSIGCLPESVLEDTIEFTPVDACAKAIVSILSAPREQLIFHIFNHHTIKIGDFLKLLRANGISIQRVSGEKFSSVISTLLQSEEGREITAGIVNDLALNANLDFRTGVEVKSALTVEFLKQLGFEWPDIGDQYLMQIISYMKKVGFLSERKNIYSL